MGKNKLRKFAEMERFACVYQYPFASMREQGECPMRGKWAQQVFGNDNPIVLELGCGKGEYTVGLARECPDKNFIGIDIKGARIYTGAKEVEEQGIANAAFLRTSIDLLPAFFAPGEVSELWITFPDPQMKKVNKRLTGTHFLDIYRHCLADGGLVKLKTDSPFLYEYTMSMLAASGIEPVAATDDLYGKDEVSIPRIYTHYEKQWLSRGMTIKYICFPLRAADVLQEPAEEPAPDTYRSYSRRSPVAAGFQKYGEEEKE